MSILDNEGHDPAGLGNSRVSSKEVLCACADACEKQAEIERLSGQLHHVAMSRDAASNIINSQRGEIDRLRALLRHADDVVIWEHTPARSGFQEEIEEALGIGHEHSADGGKDG